VQNLPIVLVVEDDYLLQAFAEEALREGGFEVAIAPSGEQAVELLHSAVGKYTGSASTSRFRRHSRPASAPA
jgi:CheY-like chemotaxis protein